MNQSNTKTRKSFFLLLFVAVLILLSASLLFYFRKNTENIAAEDISVSPFSDAVWQDTPENIIAAKGSNYTTYDSVYGGLCYTYPHDYENRRGTIKYMFNEEDRLVCVAWTYSSAEEQELYDLYHLIEESVAIQIANESDTIDKASNTGHVWYRKDGNIILGLMITSDLKALQYSYLHPDISNAPQ